MAERDATDENDSEALWIPASQAHGGRWGCIVVAAIFLIVPGIWLTASGYPGALALLIAGIVVAAAGARIVNPAGMAINRDRVVLHARSLFRRHLLEVRRDLWDELWIQNAGEDQSTLYLFGRASDGRVTTYAIPVCSGLPTAMRDAADDLQRLLAVPLRLVVIAPATDPPRRPDADWGDWSDPASLRAIRYADKIFNSFRALERPEVLLLEPHERQIRQRRADGQEVVIPFRRVADVEIVMLLAGDERGSDSDTVYVYVFHVQIVLASGERLLVRQCSSSEIRKTDDSRAWRDACWMAGYLNRTFGIAES